MMALGQNGVKKKITNKQMKFLNAGNVTIIIALLLIAYALVNYFAT